MMMMNNLFNSPFETALRVLLIMEQSQDTFYSTDMLAAIDFMSVYALDFGIADINLHGDSLFKFSEFATRRGLAKEAIKNIVLKGLISIETTNKGFQYQINQSGIDYAHKLESSYANSYREIVTKTISYIKNQPEQKVLGIINEHSVRSLQKGGNP